MLKGRRIALVEDDEIMGASIAHRLELEGASVIWRKQAQRAIGELRTPRVPIDSVVCDIRLPDGSGEEIFSTLCRDSVPPPFLFITGQGDIEQAVRLLKAGASDYILKPFEMNVFLRRLEQLMRPKPGMFDHGEFGTSPFAKRLSDQVAKAAETNRPVLIRGAGGTGKGRIARTIHAASGGIPSAFVEVNFMRDPKATSSLVGALAEIEGRPGCMLFLNGLSAMPGDAQDLLFRWLDSKPEQRIVAACGAEMERSIAAGDFRDDLFTRLEFLEIPVLPYRDRPGDAVWLAKRMFAAMNATRQPPLKGITSLAEEAIRAHDWPGNGRELRSRLHRALAMTEGEYIFPADLFPERAVAGAPLTSLAEARDAAERNQIIAALDLCHGHVGEAAKLLKISRTTLWEKMQKFSL